MTYDHLFGPVPSRRLGMSLGVDLVPKKVCSLNCVYCEVGRTTELTLDRKEYSLSKKIKAELKHYFQNNPDPEFITLTGSGEPTLNIYLGEIIAFAKELRPNIPIALITNGTLLYDKEVREAVLNADVILPSLDAATKDVLRRINRPSKSLDLEKYIRGMVDLGKEFKGRIWLEVFLLPGYNDSADELKELKKAIQRINPDSVQLNTLDRPGAVANIRGATNEEMQRVVDFWELDNVEIISSSQEGESTRSYRSDIASTIIDTIARRPCTRSDLTRIVGKHDDDIDQQLAALLTEGKIKAVEQERGTFYQLDEKA